MSTTTMPTKIGQSAATRDLCPQCTTAHLRLRLLPTDDPTRADLVRECEVCQTSTRINDVVLVPDDERAEMSKRISAAYDLLGLDPHGPLSHEEVARMQRVRAEHLPGATDYVPERDRYWLHALIVIRLIMLARKPLGARTILERDGAPRALILMIEDLA